jgi:hypothetical protein
MAAWITLNGLPEGLYPGAAFIVSAKNVPTAATKKHFGNAANIQHGRREELPKPLSSTDCVWFGRGFAWSQCGPERGFNEVPAMTVPLTGI